ncbi:hypothetical protein H7142_03830, partial [Candidatus Saccharibacteria bacterium]|nr:hypothetical protein [Candidatus Saccharibacteria bacterium]
MDEREQQIVRTFEEFKEFGLVEDEEGVTIDADSAHGILIEKVDEHEQAIDVAYEKNKSQRTSHLTKTALLRIMIDGGTDDDIRRHIDENGLSTQHSVEYRREEAIKSIGVVKSKAEKAR